MGNDTAQSVYEAGSHKLRLNLGRGLLLIALLGWACLKLKVPVPWWCVLLLIAGAIALGFIYPVLWRRKHPPLRNDPREKRLTLVKLLSRPIGFLLLIAGFVSLGDKASSGSSSLIMVVIGVGIASLPIFFKYKPEATHA
ncbi:hypothetical protein [Edaphobacter aggregans]|uniref:hypothetical protein n=1 Tax=Edaphobacter aggregans TaxID=570835 RepID=UPI000555485F|nr:hypothetical protein [Edaphobacter aggregans]